MYVFYLEVRAGGEHILEEVHVFKESAQYNLVKLVRHEWNDEMMGRALISVPYDQVVNFFFDAMEEYNYSITPFKLIGQAEAPAPVDPFPGMEPIPLGDLEVEIVRCCLDMTPPTIIRKYIDQMRHLDCTIQQVKEVRAVLIEKMK